MRVTSAVWVTCLGWHEWEAFLVQCECSKQGGGRMDKFLSAADVS